MKEYKVTFIGDIMCEPLLQKASKQNNGAYDFSSVFENVSGLLSGSDYLIGNLETPMAGEKAEYAKSLYSFNAPDAFADVLKAAKIDLVTTANNHCLDRGVAGLKHTIEALDARQIGHTGTYSSQDRPEAYYFTLGDVKCALINYTYGTNYSLNRVLLSEEEQKMVNLLRPQKEPVYLASKKKRTLITRAWNFFLRRFSLERQTDIKKALHMTYNSPRADDYLDTQSIEPYLRQMVRDIRLAKENADIVFFNPHLGGQFNIRVGKFSEYIVRKAVEAGCDAVIASHPHIVQKAECVQDIPCFYSIGNFSMSPNSNYMLFEHLPNYGLALHIYLQDKAIRRITFSVLKIIEENNRPLTVIPTEELFGQLADESARNALKKDICQIYQTVTGKAITMDQAICREFVFEIAATQGETL